MQQQHMLGKSKKIDQMCVMTTLQVIPVLCLFYENSMKKKILIGAIQARPGTIKMKSNI
jgi:hypothetical protein